MIAFLTSCLFKRLLVGFSVMLFLFISCRDKAKNTHKIIGIIGLIFVLIVLVVLSHLKNIVVVKPDRLEMHRFTNCLAISYDDSFKTFSKDTEEFKMIDANTPESVRIRRVINRLGVVDKETFFTEGR